MTSDKFIGYLVSVECKNVFFQGIVTNIDSNKGVIQLKNCFQNGLHCGNKLIDIKTVEIDNIEILADPQTAYNILKPKIQANINIEKNDIILESNNGGDGNGSEKDHKNNISSSSTSSTSSNDKKSSLNSNYTNTNASEKSLNANKRVTRQNQSLQSKRNNNQNQSRQNDFSNNNHRHNSNEAFFGSDSNENDDFDFEKNLAAFDKNAFYEQYEGHSRPNDEYDEPYSTAFNSVLKNVSLSNNYLYHQDEKRQEQQQQPTVIYHPISLANLFSLNNYTSQNTIDQQSIRNGSKSSIDLTSFLSSNSNESAPKNGNANVNGNGNYRFDEMVLDTGKPMNMQQIIVPSMKVDKRYVTDEGFVVPCIDLQLRQMIFEQSYKQGFNKQRQIECMGRSCAEMALQLVGGPLRFSKKNNHQKPTVLVLANSQHVQGVYALCTARLLSIRNVKIYLFVYNSKSEPSKKKQDDEEEIETFFKSELNLFCSTDEANFKLLNDVDDVKTLQSVDLILNGLESPDTASVVQIESQLIKYIDQYKASVVSIDPPVNGSILQSKWCITPVLPMAMSANCGRVYLCDLGFTKNMFQSVNIKYQSPFGAKFLIPLHND